MSKDNADNNDNWRDRSNINNPHQLPINKTPIPELPSQLPINKPLFPIHNTLLPPHFNYHQPPTYPYGYYQQPPFHNNYIQPPFPNTYPQPSFPNTYPQPSLPNSYPQSQNNNYQQPAKNNRQTNRTPRNNRWKKNKATQSNNSEKVKGIDDNLEMTLVFNNPNNLPEGPVELNKDKPREESILIPLEGDSVIKPPDSSNGLLGMIVQKMLNIGPEKVNNDNKDEEKKVDVEEKIDTREFNIIDEEIDTLDDLINLSRDTEKYIDPNIRYNIDMSIIKELREPLENFNNLIGLDGVKKQVLLQLLFYLQKLDTKNKDMLHTVIEGSPGVGKTELAKLLANIYNKMGILSKNQLKIVKRHDLIGSYLGQTASKTNKVLEEAKGGVLFIDEAYSLGNEENKDSYAKECIDTITSFLSENRKDFVCIIAGYKDGLEKCFFKYNEGLERRFTWRYKIDDYSNEELKDIFLQIIKKGEWEYKDEDKFISFFDKNRDYFKFNGGDMETLFQKCKLVHSKRVIRCHYNEKKKINLDDLEGGLELFLMDDNIKKRNEQLSDSVIQMYL